MLALAGHHLGKLGHGVEELIATFDAIATGSPEERADALQRIGPLQVQAHATPTEEVA